MTQTLEQRVPGVFTSVDIWDSAGENMMEHVAGVDDFETAVATYWAAVRRWPRTKVTLRQGARLVKRNWE